jgi:hypothetical protein
MAALVGLSAAVQYGQGSTQALFIDPQGRIGIGTSNPATQLDVHGPVSISLDGGENVSISAYKDSAFEHHLFLMAHISGAIVANNAYRNPEHSLELKDKTKKGSLILLGDGQIALNSLQPSAEGQIESIRLASFGPDGIFLMGNLNVGSLNFYGQKVCSVVFDNKFRDTILVPASFPSEACDKFRSIAGGSAFNLGCMFSRDITFGSANGGIPSENCGW